MIHNLFIVVLIVNRRSRTLPLQFLMYTNFTFSQYIRSLNIPGGSSWWKIKLSIPSNCASIKGKDTSSSTLEYLFKSKSLPTGRSNRPSKAGPLRESSSRTHISQKSFDTFRDKRDFAAFSSERNVFSSKKIIRFEYSSAHDKSNFDSFVMLISVQL